MLDAAVANFTHRSDPAAGQPAGALWLVEARNEGAAARLRALGDGRWSLSERDPVTWTLRRDDGASLVVVLGRQVTTAEDLEVLIAGTPDPVTDGRSLVATVEPWLGRDVLVMLPWGFGKWSGTRRRIVERAYEEYAAEGLRLADTGARAGWLPIHPVLHRSVEDGRPVFVGSDPFPFRDRIGMVASHGFVAPDVPAEAGWPERLRTLRAMTGSPPRYGKPMGTAEFIALQTRMQFRKRRGGRRGGRSERAG